MERLSIWLQFILCGAVIALAGSRLSKYGDVIADRTGLGGGLVGLVLMASVTSLPEMITGVSAVALAGAPDIAVGNVMGACAINLVMIVVLDFLQRGDSFYSRASQGHILSAAFGAMMMAFAALNLLAADQGIALSAGPIGLYSPLLLMFYLLAVRVVFNYETRNSRHESRGVGGDVTLRQAVVRYTAAALAVVAAAIWLPFIADSLAQAMGWNQSFVGTLLVSLATALPELSVSIAALRLGALDMAVGNLFGSNLFNLMLLAVQDAFYPAGPLLSHVSVLHAVTALASIMMTGLAIIGLFYRPRRRLLGKVGWISVLLAWVYLSNVYLLYRYGS